MAGRRTLLTAQRRDRLLQAVGNGAFYRTAAAYAGIAERTFHEWLTDGRRVLEDGFDPDTLEEDPYELDPTGQPAVLDARKALLALAIEEASAETELADLVVINNAADAGEWRAAAWKLERRHHQNWRKRTETMVSGPEGDTDPLMALADAIREARDAYNGDSPDPEEEVA